MLIAVLVFILIAILGVFLVLLLILLNQFRIMESNEQLDAAIQELSDKVAASNEVITSAEQLLTGLTEQLNQAINEHADDPAAAIAKIQEISSGIQAKTAELAAAVAQNTPGQGPPIIIPPDAPVQE